MKTNSITSLIYIMTLSACSVEEGSQVISSTTTHEEDISTSSVSNTSALGGDPTRSPGCVADFDNDGRVTPADVAAAVSAMNAGNIIADFDHNGRVEPADIALFINLFYAAPSNPACTGGGASDCITSTSGFQSKALLGIPAIGGYTISYQITASEVNYHGVMMSDSSLIAGYADSRASIWHDMGPTFHIRSGPNADPTQTSISYTVAQPDVIKIHVSSDRQTFSASLRHGLSAEQTLISNATFSQNIPAVNTLGFVSPAGGSSTACNFNVTADAPEVAPLAPSNLVASVQTNSPTVNLTLRDNANNETRIEIDRLSSAGAVLQTLTLPANSISGTDSPGNGTFSYRARACNSLCSAYTTSNSVTVNYITPPSTGWTDLTPSSDSQLVYVDPSNCSANNTFHRVSDSMIGPDPRHPSSISQIHAVCTTYQAQAFLREGQPDWMLLRKGRSFTGSRLLGGHYNSGRSATERMVYTSYGDVGETIRPKLILERSVNGIYAAFQNNSPTDGRASHLAFIGLEFLPAAGYEWAHDGPYGDVAVRGFYFTPLSGENALPAADNSNLTNGINLLIEDNKFTNLFRGGDIGSVNHVVIRRNVFQDIGSYPNNDNICSLQLNGRSPQAFWIGNSQDITFEENILPNKFYTLGIRNPTIQDSGLYFGGWGTYFNEQPINVRKNIFIYKGNKGIYPIVQLRSGGNADDNFFYGGAAAISSAGAILSPYPPQYSNGFTGRISGNAILNGLDIDPNNPDCHRGTGIAISATNGFNISNNIIANKLSVVTNAGYGPGTGIILNGSTGWGEGDVRNALVENNTIFNWNGISTHLNVFSSTIRNNQIQNPGNTSNQMPLFYSYLASMNQLSFSGNTYSSALPLSDWFSIGDQPPYGVSHDFFYWKANVEPTAVQQSIPYASPNGDHLLRYGNTVGLNDIDSILNAMASQSRDTWNPSVTIDPMLNYVRANFGR